MGEAAEYCKLHNDEISQKINSLAEAFVNNITKIGGVSVYIERPKAKLVSLMVDGVDAASLVMALSNAGVAVSSGAACSSHNVQPSHVLTAAGRTKEEAASTVRVSFSEENSFDEIREACSIFEEQIQLLRKTGASYEQGQTNEARESSIFS